MAQFFPSRTTCRFDTPGERRLAERLEKKLEDDYLCWFNVPVGPKALQPDFVLMHPLRGLLVLEVKDWKLDTIQSMDRDQARIYADGLLKTLKNPMLQARTYTMEVVMMLQRDPALTQPAGSPYAGNLIMPFGWGVVMTAITRKQFEGTNLAEVLNPQQVLFQDEITETVDAEAFQQRLWNMFQHIFPCQLSLPQIDRVRYHLYPEVRVNTLPGQFGLFAEQHAPLPTLLRVMDLQQEQLARSMGEGHRVIHGVAGSGKTMILGYRAQYLSQALANKPILILCFNRALAARLQQMVEERGMAATVSARNFHGWCNDQWRLYHLRRLLFKDAATTEKLVQTVVQGVDNGQVPRAQYGAV